MTDKTMINILTGETVTIECPKEEKIAGYRELAPLEKHEINKIKKMEQCLLKEINNIAEDNLVKIDGRWLAIGRTSIEQGFMAIIRAIAEPDTVRMPDERFGGIL